MGARMSEVLSPIPPVECLSTFLPGNLGMIEDFSRVQHHFGERRQLGRFMPRIHTAISHAAIW